MCPEEINKLTGNIDISYFITLGTSCLWQGIGTAAGGITIEARSSFGRSPWLHVYKKRRFREIRVDLVLKR